MLPIAVACRWSLLLLSRLLSAQALYDGYLLPLETARTLQGMGPRPVRAGSCLALGLWPEGCRGSDAQGRVLTIISAERV